MRQNNSQINEQNPKTAVYLITVNNVVKFTV